MIAAARLLDNGRKLKVARAKLEKLQALLPTDSEESGAAAAEAKGGDNKQRVKSSTVAKLKTEVNNLGQETIAGYTLTGSRAKRIRKWINALPAETLEFYALNFPFNNWKELADMVHARKEDFALPYFLSVAFGAPAPEKSLYLAAQNVTSETLEKGESHPLHLPPCSAAGCSARGSSVAWRGVCVCSVGAVPAACDVLLVSAQKAENASRSQEPGRRPDQSHLRYGLQPRSGAAGAAAPPEQQ